MAKNIIICSDGTWNKWESSNEKNTNVARLWEALIDQEGMGQVAFYDAGVGTGMSRYIGGATGYGISQNILDCYGEIIKRYRPGDRIYLFGFSRGAYTVRSLSGLLYACGVLKHHDEALIRQAYRIYRDGNKTEQVEFKARHGVSARVKMIGVWDTVGALGIPVGLINKINPFFHRFHDTKLNPVVDHCYHAVAIDEQREPFAPTLWDESNKSANQTVEQVWFPGVHSDVGGGYPERGLADIALNWMVIKARRHGVRFKPQHLARIAPDHKGPLHDSRSGWKRLLMRKEIRDIRPGRKTWIHVAAEDKARTSSRGYTPSNVIEPWSLGRRYSVAVSDPATRFMQLDSAA
ncbi:MAG: DUF2235 domain-containing protein [Gammaproteobacteria bacterium]